MSSQRRLLSSRANGAKSRGPVTTEGKACSAMNALKHGFRSPRVTLGNESEDAFERLHDEYVLAFHPEGRVECDLVRELAISRWRLQRYWGAEASMLNDEMHRNQKKLGEQYKELDESTRTALAFRELADTSCGLSLGSFYETRLRRTFSRALAELQLLQRARLSPAPEPEPVGPRLLRTPCIAEEKKWTNEPSPENEHPDTTTAAA